MSQLKVLTVVGARPQFVKAAVVSRALAESGNVREVIAHTGQHFDDNMSTVFFDELEIPQPQYNLGIGGGSHGANTGRAIEALEGVMLAEKPDWVLVYGDTDSTLAGAVAASKLSIDIAHCEAGLRSFNRMMPEEINRVLTDHVSKLLLVPSQAAIKNLGREGIVGDAVQCVGDVMYDAVRVFSRIAEEKSKIIEDLGLKPKDYILATIHRKENVDTQERLSAILAGFAQVPGRVVLPVHPRTRNRFKEFEIVPSDNIMLIDPVGYFDMMRLEAHARAIATDSGGVQKEAYFHGVPCAVLRDETEWVELVELGVNRLVGANSDDIAHALASPMPNLAPRDVYGAGDAAAKIASLFVAASA